MSEIHTSTIIKLGGKKHLGHKWQWRTCTILSNCKLKYADPKANAVKGYLELVSSEIRRIDASDKLYHKFTKLKKPKNPSGAKSIDLFSYFSLKPKDSIKTYYFGCSPTDADEWLKYIDYCRKGEDNLKNNLKIVESMPTLLIHSNNYDLAQMKAVSPRSPVANGQTPIGLKSSSEEQQNKTPTESPSTPATLMENISEHMDNNSATDPPLKFSDDSNTCILEVNTPLNDHNTSDPIPEPSDLLENAKEQSIVFEKESIFDGPPIFSSSLESEEAIDTSSRDVADSQGNIATGEPAKLDFVFD